MAGGLFCSTGASGAAEGRVVALVSGGHRKYKPSKTAAASTAVYAGFPKAALTAMAAIDVYSIAGLLSVRSRHNNSGTMCAMAIRSIVKTA